MVSPDYEELFSTLNAHKVKYLVVGAHAVVFYTQPRFTKDLAKLMKRNRSGYR